MYYKKYGKRRYKKKSYGSYRKYGKYKKSSNIARRVKNIEQADMQAYIGSGGVTDLVTAGNSIRMLSVITQGDGEGDRQGRRITIKQFGITLSLQHTVEFNVGAQTYNTADQFWRVLLIRWYKPDGAAFSSVNLFADATTSYTKVHSKYNTDTISGMKIIYDKVFQGGINNTVKELPYHIKLLYKPKKMVTKFTDNTGAVTGISENEIILYIQQMWSPGQVNSQSKTVANTDTLCASYYYQIQTLFYG